MQTNTAPPPSLSLIPVSKTLTFYYNFPLTYPSANHLGRLNWSEGSTEATWYNKHCILQCTTSRKHNRRKETITRKAATHLETYDRRYVLFFPCFCSPLVGLGQTVASWEPHHDHEYFLSSHFWCEKTNRCPCRKTADWHYTFPCSHTEIYGLMGIQKDGQWVSQGGRFYCPVSSFGSMQRHDIRSRWFQQNWCFTHLK